MAYHRTAHGRQHSADDSSVSAWSSGTDHIMATQNYFPDFGTSTAKSAFCYEVKENQNLTYDELFSPILQSLQPIQNMVVVLHQGGLFFNQAEVSFFSFFLIEIF